MRRHHSFALLFVVALLGACIASAPSRSAEASRAPAVSAGTSETQPAASEEPSASTAVEQPTASTAAPPDAGASASPSAGTGAAATCSGTDSNRTFFEDAAVAVKWTVYCAVLPA